MTPVPSTSTQAERAGIAESFEHPGQARLARGTSV